MANNTNAKTIRTNLKGVLVTTLGYQFQDISSDPTIETTPLVTMRLQNIEAENNFNENAKFFTMFFDLIITKNGNNEDTMEEAMIDIFFDLRTNITETTLGSGLSALSAVTWVSVENGLFSDQDDTRTINQLFYNISVRFREV